MRNYDLKNPILNERIPPLPLFDYRAKLENPFVQEHLPTFISSEEYEDPRTNLTRDSFWHDSWHIPPSDSGLAHENLQAQT